MKSAMQRDWGVASRGGHCNVHGSVKRAVLQLLARTNRMVMARGNLAEKATQHAVPLTKGTARGERRKSDAAGGRGEVEPDFNTAEVGAFGADGGGDVGAEVAGGADVFGELGVDFAELGYFVHRGGVDFFLGVEAGSHGPFVEEME